MELFRMVKSDGTLGVDEGRFPKEMLQVLVKGGGKGDDEKEFKAGSSIANDANANNANDTTTSSEPSHTTATTQGTTTPRCLLQRQCYDGRLSTTYAPF